MNVDDAGTMALAVSHGMGLARMRVVREFLIELIEGRREIVLVEVVELTRGDLSGCFRRT